MGKIKEFLSKQVFAAQAKAIEEDLQQMEMAQAKAIDLTPQPYYQSLSKAVNDMKQKIKEDVIKHMMESDPYGALVLKDVEKMLPWIYHPHPGSSPPWIIDLEIALCPENFEIGFVKLPHTGPCGVTGPVGLGGAGGSGMAVSFYIGGGGGGSGGYANAYMSGSGHDFEYQQYLDACNKGYIKDKEKAKELAKQQLAL